MEKRYEYEFVRLEGREAEHYHEVIEEYTQQGWRLVQVLAPGAGGLWAKADFFEVIFERKVVS